MPALLGVAAREGWWRFDGPGRGSEAGAAPAADEANPTVIALTAEILDRVRLAPHTIAPADPGVGLALLRAAVRGGAAATGAVIGEWLVGVALAAPTLLDGVDELVALGVAPASRRGGIAMAMLRALVDEQDHRERALVALHTAAERDPFDPLPREVRRDVATALAQSTGFKIRAAPSELTAADPSSRAAAHLPPGAQSGLGSRAESWLVGR